MIDLSGTGLPLVPFLPRISELLERHRGLALTAEPGAGKSTLVPPYLLDEPWLGGQRILMLEPRRLAAASVATRIAELLGEPVGRRAGYRVRTASRVSRDTRIEVITEALLTRLIQEDPLLQGVGVVILDELHERSIHADLALALALEVRRARPDLALLAMSATLDTEPVAMLLGGHRGDAMGRAPSGEPGSASGAAPVLHCPGRSHPVRTLWRPAAREERWEEAFADCVAQVFDDTEGGILAFLPGAGEIRRVGARLSGLLIGRAEILPLHGTMRLEDQQRVIRPTSGEVGGAAGAGAPAAGAAATAAAAAPRRVILATSIAETSLTVPGISTVVDSGWARLSRLHPATGLDRLATERVSASAAEQRRGRAGRLGPGLCVRFWPEQMRLSQRADPEILRSDLSGLVLECALWGAREPGALSWLDAPSAPAWSQAVGTLRMLGLVDSDGPTALGRTVATLGLAPRLGVLAVRGAEAGQPSLAAACAALLEERDGSGIARDPDFRLRLEAIRLGAGGASGSSEAWRRAVETEMARILRRSGVPGLPDFGWPVEQEQRVGDLLAWAFADRLARREPDGSYQMVTGRVARFPGADARAGSRVAVASRAAAAWIVVLDADPGETWGTIRLAAPVDRAHAEQVLERAAEEKLQIRWEGLVPKAALERRAGRLILAARPARPAPEEIAESFMAELARRGPGLLPWNARSRSLLSRMRFYARTEVGRALGELSDEGLVARARDWLAPVLAPGGGQAVSPGSLLAALERMLGSSRAAFARDVPETITLPTGGKRAVDYEGDAPAVEARIQEVFGLAASPLVCGVPLTFRLLSPARRPLQITRDLKSFWGTTYAEVRGEMRSRYPKHYWPENPLDAEPTAGVRPRR